MRYFFRASGLNQQPVGYLVLAGLVITLLIQVYMALKAAQMGRIIDNDPELKTALNDELVQSLEVRAWKAAYFGAVGATVFFALAWFFYPVCDPVMVALTAIITGLGANRAAFYFLYKWS